VQTVASWPAPSLPTVPGGGGPISLFDSATGRVEPTSTPDGAATLYVCGITPYDATHLGHASTYVAFDTLGRAWRDAGLRVRFAQNITDVDDPLLERAEKTGRDWREIALDQTDLFRGDMRALRVIPPDAYVRVQDSIDETASAVAAYLDAGFAYRVPIAADADPAPVDPDATDVYFDVAAAGERTPWTLGSTTPLDAQARAEAFVEFGGDPDRPGKRGPFDPLVWRAARTGEPSWDTIVGPGRPGWHIECAVIATGELGGTVSVQAGGRDLTFPHHDLSAGHASALTGEPFARHFAHAGLIAYDGTKMSKSLGNLVLVSKLTASGVDPAAIRLAIVRHHYRADWEWTDMELAEAQAQLASWRAHADAVAKEAGPNDADAEPLAAPTPEDVAASAFARRMREAIAADLDTPAVVQIVDEWAATGSADPVVPALVDALLGIRLV